MLNPKFIAARLWTTVVTKHGFPQKGEIHQPLVDAIAEAIQEAVEAERERCAKIADDVQSTLNKAAYRSSEGIDESMLEKAQIVCEIGHAIRTPREGQEP